MGEAAKKRAVYDDLYTIPENMIGEIIDGELFVSPRPSPRHSKVSSVLSMGIGPPFQFAHGGPGGWIILYEVEIKLAEECHPIVPDLSGWRIERFPETIDTNWISVPPDWVCEILSPRTVRLDRVTKMPKYLNFGVQYVWLIDPSNKTMEVYRSEAGRWVVLGVYAEKDRVRAEPFQEIEIDLEGLWID